MSGDFYKEWRIYAEVDYFSQFILLWLSTNAWYRSHYAEITSRKVNRPAFCGGPYVQ